MASFSVSNRLFIPSILMDELQSLLLTSPPVSKVAMSHKIFVTGDAYAVGVNHHRFDTLLLRHLKNLQQAGVDGWFAATELHYVGIALVLDHGIEHALYFL